MTTEFDISTASETFAKIAMIYQGKSSVVRAQIGKGNFAKVKRAYHSNGKPKLSKNKASVYVCVKQF